jgi:hypothetical protein
MKMFVKVYRTFDGVRTFDELMITFEFESEPSSKHLADFEKWVIRVFQGRDMNALMTVPPTPDHIAHVLEAVAGMFFVGSVMTNAKVEVVA